MSCISSEGAVIPPHPPIKWKLALQGQQKSVHLNLIGVFPGEIKSSRLTIWAAISLRTVYGETTIQCDGVWTKMAHKMAGGTYLSTKMRIGWL